MIKKIKNFIKDVKRKRMYKKCNHEWREFDSGYKQCIHCKLIEKS